MYKTIKEAYYAKFEPNIWSNDNIKGSHNCYSYFLNDISDTLAQIHKIEDNDDRRILNPQPGHYCGMTTFVNYEETTCDLLNKRVLCDNPDITVLPKGVGQDYDCGENYYKGALKVRPKDMYHFYRQDEDGYWSHKDGGGEVIKLYKDPKDIRDEYPEFCNYYCVPKNSYKDTNMARNRDGKIWYKN